MPKNIDEVKKFLNNEKIMVLATVDKTNKPNIVPMFFTYDINLYMMSRRKTRKIRNIKRNENVAASTQNGGEAVVIMGRAGIVGIDEYKIKTKEYIKKYNVELDEFGRDSKMNPLFDEKINCVIKIEPDQVLFW